MFIRAKNKYITSIFSLSVLAGALATATTMEEEAEVTTPQLEATVVTAPRFVDVDIEVPSRVKLIDQLVIEQSGATNLVDLLKNEANVHFRSTSGNAASSEISIGGFGENSGQRVLILLDGQRLNTADLGQINWLSIPLALVESVEVIKGGQASLYGNNAVGGVIKITTRRPSEDFYGSAQTSAGSFDSFNARIGMSGREGGLGFSAHVEHDETDGYRDNSQYQADGAGLKLDWIGVEWLSAYGSFSGVSSEYGLPASLAMAQLQADRKQSSSPNDTGEEDAYFIRGGIALCTENDVSFALDSGYTDKEIFSDYLSFGATSKQEYEIFSITPKLIYATGRFTGVLGVDYYDDQVDGLSEGFGTTRYAFHRETYAGFGSFKLDLGTEWILSGSLRVESAQTYGSTQGVKSKDINDDEYAWSLGLIRLFEGNHRVYASVRRFYRYPATDEIITVFFAPVPVINFNLEPEWGHEVELGADWLLGDLTIGGRIYHQWMRDEVFLDYGSFQSFNFSRTSRTGIDLDMSYKFSDSFNASLNYNWVNAELDSGAFDGSEVPLVPEHKARVALNYQPRSQLTTSIGATYTNRVFIGGDYDNTKSALDSYVLMDLNLRYVLNSNVELFATVDNLLDKEYTSFGFSGFFNDGFYPGVGRSAKIGVTVRF